MGSCTSGNRCVAAIAACSSILLAAAPPGWIFAGKSQEYDCSVDPDASHNGQLSSYIKSRPGLRPTGFGSLVKDISATPYIGKRVRLSANLKTEDVVGWGGLWMRVDDANHPKNGYPSSVAFDNMHDGMRDRSIKGTTAWQTYSIVLDVPEGATGIYIGVALTGQGTLWINGHKLEVVGTDVPVTGKPLNQAPPLDLKPRNLSFDK